MNDEIVKQFLENPVEGRLALSASLKNFIAFFFWYMYRQQFIFRPFHNLIIKKLEDIAFGRAEKKNLIINVPPRFGKSAIMQMLCSWSYMLNPHSNCIYTSYSDDLTSSFSKDIRSIIESDAFKTLTGIKLNKAKSGADYWATTIGGGFRAASMGGSITGFGAGVSGNDFGGCMIIDDPNKASSVKSQAELQNTIDYYNNTLKSRLNNQSKTPIILIMQRLALEDLTGYLLENEAEDWDIIKLQGLNEDTGEALWEEKYPAEELLKLKKVNPFVYYGQYQQEPIVVGGSVIKTEWFRYYDPKDVYDYQFTFITSDTAQKKGEANDFSVFSFWGKTFDNKLHLLDMVRGKWEADELRQQVKLCWKKWSSFKTAPYGFYVEDKSSGIGVIQEIKKTDPIPIIPVTRARYKNDQGQWVAADKFSRVMTAAPYLANGWVYLPNGEKDDISAPLLAECAAFRADLSHKHDDMCFVDMTIIATSKGKKKISDVYIGDKILTPFGYSKVLATSKREAEVITNISLTGTPDHKVFNKYDYNFDKLKNMTYSQVSKLTFKDMLEWKKQIVFNLMARNIIVAKRKDISQLAMITKTRKVEQGFIEMFGSFIRERKYRKAIIFTIKMGIGLITIFQTLSAYHAKSILKDIGKRLWIFGKDLKCEKQTQEVERNVRSGTQVKQDISGTQSIRKNISNRSCKNKYANRVAKSSEHLQTQDIKQCAINAEIENCTSSLDNRKKIVYNIQTEAGCYYANGILVSNCDTLCDAVDIAFGSTGISSIFI